MGLLRRAAGVAGAAGAGLAALALLRRRRRRRSLEGRTVLITGGSRGLGLVLARRFGEAGCRVAICARDERELAAARRDLEGRGFGVLARRCDVRSPEEVEALVETAEDHLGPVDLLVNNAGIIQSGPVATMTREDFRRAMDTNFHGALNTTLAVLPRMRRRGRGRIVNIASIGGVVPVPHLLPYVCSKFALVGLSEGLRTELSGSGVGVTTVVPGLMRTGSPAHARFKGRREAEYAWFALGDSLPLTSISADRAARRIVAAAARGAPWLVLSGQAKLLRLAYALLPGPTLAGAGLAARLLPSAPGADGLAPGAREPDPGTRGMELAHPLAPSLLTRLTDRAARRNNEYGGWPRPSPEHARRAGLRREETPEAPPAG